MNDTPVNAYNLFGVPIFTFTLDPGLTTQETEYVLNLEQRGNQVNFASKDTYVLNHPTLFNLKKFCSESIVKSFKLLVDPPQETEIYITQSWVNVTKPLQSHHVHWHKNSYLSGVFYVQTIPHDIIVIENPLNQLVPLHVNCQSWNTWNCEEWEIPVHNNTLLVFPSYLKHYVRSNKSAVNRVSLAMNTFLKGTIGTNDTFTELQIFN